MEIIDHISSHFFFPTPHPLRYSSSLPPHSHSLNLPLYLYLSLSLSTFPLNIDLVYHKIYSPRPRYRDSQRGICTALFP
jgi:hypothetical protein